MIKAIFRLIVLCVLLTSVPVKADVSIPRLVPPKNGLLKLTLVNGFLVEQELTLSQWNALNLTAGHASVDQMRFGGIDGDDVVDLVMTLNGFSLSTLTPSNLKRNIVGRSVNTGCMSSVLCT